ncbi:amidohydrolase [Rudaeicoccus suwonensis]|uniref:amidohydrolase n=1 Tax=Rudaeicoccus suwonensis TaxID=657409 RepID=UPI001FE298C9|nr:amidohydrolase [Rudaeicoccus suwonensis]
MTVLYRHSRIYTGDPQRPYATGLLADDDVILAIGDFESLAVQHREATVVELGGALVLPGMHDAHIHTASLARELAALDLRRVTTLEQALQHVQQYAETIPSGAWIMGGRWDSNKWTPPGQPTRHDLDRVSGDHPVALASIDGHTMWVNTAALSAVGITFDTPDPAGGVIARDDQGSPTGILREAACEAVERVYASPVSGDLADQLAAAQEHLLSVGLTSVTDLDGEDARAAYLRMKSDGWLNIRVTKGIPVTHLDAAIAEGRRSGDGDDWLRVGPVKLFSDGALGSHTCHMSHGFRGDESNHGMPVLSHEQVLAYARRATDAGIAVATHAIGDQAAHTVLGAYEQLRAETGTSMTLSIEHSQFLQPDDVHRMAQLGVTASMQPTHCTSDITLCEAMLPDSPLVAYGWRTLLDAGVAVAFGSDAPVEDPNPFFGLHAAVTRQRFDGTPAGGWQPHERVTINEAIAAHTAGSARLTGDFTRKGRLTAGRLADFIAIDTDITDPELIADEPLRIRTAQVLQTVVGGETRWSR